MILHDRSSEESLSRSSSISADSVDAADDPLAGWAIKTTPVPSIFVVHVIVTISLGKIFSGLQSTLTTSILPFGNKQFAFASPIAEPIMKARINAAKVSVKTFFPINASCLKLIHWRTCAI